MSSNFLKKIALGTVQFGLDYGINNKGGQVKEKEVSQILELCKVEGIDLIDTAFAYGKSESVLGNYQMKDFKVVSKLPPTEACNVDSFFEKSITRLNLSSLYGYLIHNFSIYEKDKKVWQKLQKLKDQKKVDKIGVSLYTPEELYRLWDDKVFPDLVQVPFNIFDRRFESVFKELKGQNVEIHTRSSFLQGLFFKQINQLPDHFNGVVKRLEKIHSISIEQELNIAKICIQYILNNDFIDKIVIGVDNSDQLKKNILDIKAPVINSVMNQLSELEVLDEKILNPGLWQI